MSISTFFPSVLLHKSPRKICIFISLLQGSPLLPFIPPSPPRFTLPYRFPFLSPRARAEAEALRLRPRLSALSTVQGSIRRSLSELFTFTTFWYYVEPSFPFMGLLQKVTTFLSSAPAGTFTAGFSYSLFFFTTPVPNVPELQVKTIKKTNGKFFYSFLSGFKRNKRMHNLLIWILLLLILLRYKESFRRFGKFKRTRDASFSLFTA